MTDTIRRSLRVLADGCGNCLRSLRFLGTLPALRLVLALFAELLLLPQQLVLGLHCPVFRGCASSYVVALSHPVLEAVVQLLRRVVVDLSKLVHLVEQGTLLGRQRCRPV